MLPLRFLLVALGLLVVWAAPASAELLALLNYESKPGQGSGAKGSPSWRSTPNQRTSGKS